MNTHVHVEAHSNAIARFFGRHPAWRESLRDAELSQATKNCIETTVQSTRLWEAEKADVVEELIAHFRDGIEAGVSEKFLLESFGDTIQTAKMIRKSKIRCRRVFWHLAVWFWRSIAVVFVCYFLMILWVSVQVSVPLTNAWAAVNPKTADLRTEFAWTKYEAAVRLLDPEHGEEGRQPGSWLPQWAVRQNENPREISKLNRQWLQSKSAVMELLHEASRLPVLGIRLGPDDNYKLARMPSADASLPRLSDPSFHSKLPHLAELMALAEIVGAHCEVEIQSGNGESAYRDVETLLGLADQLPQTLYGVPHKLIIMGQALVCIRSALEHRPELWSEQEWAALSGKLARSQVNVEQVFTDARVVFQDAMHRIYSSNGSGLLTISGLGRVAVDLQVGGMQEPTDHPLIRHAVSPVAVFTLPTLSEVERLFEQLLAHERVLATTPIWEDLAPIEMDAHSIAYGMAQPYLPTMLPLQTNLALLQSRKDGLLVGIALELYHREFGQWPEKLDDLTVRYLSEIPKDVINNLPLRMNFRDGHPIVYGLGSDADDDGGVPPQGRRGVGNRFYFPASPRDLSPPDGDWVLWETGVDLATR